MSKFTEAMNALHELQDAKDAFDAAIAKFRRVYTPKSVGLNEWQENNETTMLDLYDDIENQLGEE